MVERSGSLEQRLKDWLCEKVLEKGKQEGPFYELIRPPDAALVCEREISGDASVAGTVPDGWTCIQWRFTSGLFGFLKETKHADGPFLLRSVDGRIEAHILECKRTVDQKHWFDVAAQMRWTLCRLLALAGVLGLTLDAVVLYTAYRFDRLSEGESPNPTASKRLLGPPDEQSPEEIEFTEARRQQLAWERDQVRLRGFEGVFPHQKIALDESTGRGAFTFAVRV